MQHPTQSNTNPNSDKPHTCSNWLYRMCQPLCDAVVVDEVAYHNKLEKADSIVYEFKKKESKGMTASPAKSGKKSVTDDDVREYIQLLVDSGDMLPDTEAAKLLGVTTVTLWRWKNIPGFNEALHKAVSKAYSHYVPLLMKRLVKTALETGDPKRIQLAFDRIVGPVPIPVDLRQVVESYSTVVLEFLAKYGRDGLDAAIQARSGHSEDVSD